MNNIYFDITKSVDNDDGTITAIGIASTASLDSQGDIITAKAMADAIPGFMSQGGTGPLREMHQPIAAGIIKSAIVNAEGQTIIEALIVDANSVKKAKAGVFKGFSIGGKALKKQGNTISELELREISLVDRPANSEAVITLWKADMSTSPTVEVQEVVAQVETIVAAVETPAAPIRKGMYSVAVFAPILQSIAYLQSECKYETEYEEDGSMMPEALKAWLATGLDLLVEMTGEEASELLAVAKAASATDIEKAGAKFSKTSKGQLTELHGLVQKCDELMKSLGYEAAAEPDADEVGKAAGADDISKAAVVDAPVAQAIEMISKADVDSEIAKALAPVSAERDLLKSRVAELEAMPVAPKAALHVVEKSESTAREVTEIKKSDGTVNETATLIKAAMANNRFVIGR